MNIHGIKAIYRFEMARTGRTLMQSIASPVLSTSLYFIVFGSAIGSRMVEIDGISYGAFIIPGLVMLLLLNESTSNASFGIYFPRFTGTIYEILSAPLSFAEVAIGYVGAAATKSVIIGIIVLGTAGFFVPLEVQHPFWMCFFLLMTCVTFALLGFIIGIWADGFERLLQTGDGSDAIASAASIELISTSSRTRRTGDAERQAHARRPTGFGALPHRHR